MDLTAVKILLLTQGDHCVIFLDLAHVAHNDFLSVFFRAGLNAPTKACRSGPIGNSWS